MSSSVFVLMLAVAAPATEPVNRQQEPASVVESTALRSLHSIPTPRAILAQQGFMNRFGVQANGNLAEIIPRVIRPHAWEQNGGRGRIILFQRGGGGFGAIQQRNGDSLVDLIQETVEPDSWEINGGDGRIAIFGQ